MDALNVLNAFFDSMSLSGLYKCKSVLEDKIKLAKVKHKSEVKHANISDYVQLHNNYIPTDKINGKLFSAVQAEVESFDLCSKSGSKTVAKWLSADSEAYSWTSSSGKKFVNKPTDISNCPAISELMEKINSEHHVEMNSCLVTCFKDGTSGIRLHCDDEDEIDQESPICVFTIGEERKVEFLSAYQNASEAPLLSITPKEGSLYLMNPGCQSLFRHRVPSMKTSSGVRYSLSFRRKLSSEPTTTVKLELDSPVKSIMSKFNKSCRSDSVAFTKGSPSVQTVGMPQPASVSSPPQHIQQPTTNRRTTTVLFGTSITTRINGDNISSKGHPFINVSRSGATMETINDMVQDFHDTNPASNDVEKVILSFGTNDIARERHGVYNPQGLTKHQLYSRAHSGVKKFRQQAADIVKKVKALYPGVIVVIQCVLPMQNRYWYTTTNVLAFNDMLRDIARSYNCYYIDCFDRFLSRDKRDFNKGLYYDSLHLNKWGLNLLCKSLKYVTCNNSNMFGSIIKL